MNWKELIVSEIERSTPKVVSLDLKKARVRYSDRIRQNVPVKRISEDAEIIRAYMVHRFVNRMGYAPESLELDRPYIVGENRDTVTVDVVVNDEDGAPFFFATAVAPDDFGTSEGSEKNRLFLAAEKEFEQTGRIVRHLFHFTVKIENERLAHESVIVDYSHFHRMADWDRQEEESSGVRELKADRFRRISRKRRKMVEIRYGDNQFIAFFSRT